MSCRTIPVSYTHLDVYKRQAQRGIECDPAEFWAALNLIYSDYVKVAKKFNVGSNIDFYVDMAKAFLDDKDAGPDKLAKYFQYVVR